jgi:MFS family permease
VPHAESSAQREFKRKIEVIEVATDEVRAHASAADDVRKPVVLVALLLAAFAINLDTTIVNVALPTLVRELHASTSQLEWIVDAYSLTFAALVLAAGNFSDRLGRKGILLVGLGVFTVATVAGGLGTNPGQLIAARAVMGLGAALIFPATLSLLTNVFTERAERARAIGLWGATTGIGIAVGPIVGGWLLEQFSWQSVFFALAPIALAAALLVALRVPSSRDPETPPADRVGLALSTLAMAAAIYTVIEAPNRGWSATTSLAGFALAAVALIAFVAWEHHVEEPMLDVALFRNLRFSAASAAVTITFFSMMGFIFLVTMYFQFLRGLRPAGDRRAAAAGRDDRRRHLDPRHQARRPQRHQARGRLRPARARGGACLDLDRGDLDELSRDRRPDGAARRGDGANERPRDRVDHGRGPGR